ncbi:phage tail protein [Vibrio cholerae]|uniref:phage tail protein n=1 Tax=Vibrio cholerae TaxID=666 RepID=UPI0021AFEC84|nr:phage tail protein [Vibrio cholerae]
MSIPESALNYGSILTLAGENAEINGKLNSKPINFTHIAIGDANDVYVQPSRTQTALVHELARIPITGMEKITPSKPDAVPQLKVWAKIPDDIVDIAVREFAAVATFDGSSYLHAVGNTVRIPILSGSNNGGEVNDIYIEMTFAVTSLDPIVMIDPTIVTATRKFVKDEDAKHLVAENPHPQYMRFGEKASCWASMPIGHPFALETHIEGVEPPPKDDARFRFIKLSRNDAYNDDILINEIVSGVAPVLSITAEINFPQSPMHGQRVELRNSSKPFSRAGENDGEVITDTSRDFKFSVTALTDGSLAGCFSNASENVILSRISGVPSPTVIGSQGRYGTAEFKLSSSVPVSDQVQPVHIEEPYFMKIFG